MNALPRGLDQPLAQALGWALLHFLWQGLAIAVVLALSLAVMRRRSSPARYAVSCAALSAMGLLPVATSFWCHSIPNAKTSALSAISMTTMMHHPPQLLAGPIAPEVAEPLEQLTTADIATVNQVAAILQEAAQAVVVPMASLSQPWQDRVRTAIPWWIAAWLCGVLILSLRLVAIWCRVQRMRRVGVTPVSNEVCAMVARIAAKLQITRPVQLLQSTLVEVPTVIGWLRPVILLPISSLTGLMPVQLEAILIHELAHIRRWDYLVNLLQNVIETLLFYHPAVWWVSSKIRQERENCCDDLAAAVCGDVVGYAEALVRMEELRVPWGQVAIAARGGNLLVRVRRLMSAAQQDRLRPWWQSPAATLVVVAALVAGTWSFATATADPHAASDAEPRDNASGEIEHDNKEGEDEDMVDAATAAGDDELSNGLPGWFLGQISVRDFPEEPAGASNDATVLIEYFPRPTRDEEKIIKALHAPTSLEWADFPFEKCIEFLQQQHKINIWLDKQTLRDEGVALDQPVTLKLAGVSLRSILKLLLEPLQLTYVVEDDVLKITTTAKAGEKLLTRTYPVRDLWGHSIPSDLETAIARTIEPDSWAEDQGPGSMTYVRESESLVIRHTCEAHEQILQLLRNLRDAKRAGQGAPQKQPQAPLRTGWKLKGLKRAETYTLVGIMDLDGDGEDESDRVRELIKAAGGSIDNQVDNQGVLRVNGRIADDGRPRITEKTKFVVVGKIPEIADTADPDEIAVLLKIAELRKTIEDQARAQGVRIVRLGDFLEYVGYEPLERQPARP